MKKRKSLGEKLRELRETYDLSQSQVAEALNIDRSTYSNYELNKTEPDLDKLVKLAHIYNIPKVLLLPDEDNDVLTFRDYSRSDSMLKTLSKEERGLIVLYRALDKDEKARMKEEMEKLAKKHD
ncbi:MAG: helix-turn-helix domain-containing protein [Ruminococcus sp.]|nr:helix-turn-helix domain-containing protein [Ruminococcus sp.]